MPYIQRIYRFFLAGDNFTQKTQRFLIILLLVFLVGIAQNLSFTVYKVSIVLIFVTGLIQVAVGNIPPESSVSRFFKFVGIFGAIIVGLFALSIWLAPILVGLGR